MKTVVVGTVAFDAIETPFGKTDRVVGGSATYISLAASYFSNDIGIVSVVGDDFPQEMMDALSANGFDVVCRCPFLFENNEIPAEHWNLTYVAKPCG